MKITIGKISPGLVVSECVVRELPDPEGDETATLSPQLQARIQHQSGKRPPSLLCDVLYTSAAGEFLGMDNFDTQYQESWREDFFPLGMPLRIPVGAEAATLSISIGRGGWFWGLFWKTVAILFLVLLAAWTVKVFRAW